MPAVAKSRHAKHAQTPYSRQKKQQVKQSDDGEILKQAGATGLLENAAKGLFRMVSWVFTSGEDLSKTVSASASKAVHRSPPQRSLTSQLEDGTLATRSESMLAPDLIPHYLGKTPKIVKARRESQTQRSTSMNAFQVPKFDSASFKIPALPTPTADKSRRHERNYVQQVKSDDAPPRGRSLKALEISADTQARRDEELSNWLTSQNLSPEELLNGVNSKMREVDDQDKLHRIMSDSGFFRRRGLFPPIVRSQRSSSSYDTRTDLHRNTVDTEGSKNHGRRSVSRNSATSFDEQPSEKSSITLRGRRINSRNWQTTSSTGILAAWRDICAEQEFVAQNKSLGLSDSKSTVLAHQSGHSEEEISSSWPEGLSFSQDGEVAEALRSVPEVDTDVIEAGEKYWAPIRSYPMPATHTKSDVDMRSVASTLRNNTNHRRRHSRQASNARRPRQAADKNVQRTPRDSRQQTPVSAVSSHRSSSRRPTNAGASKRIQREHTAEQEPTTTKPVMVDSQVQTTDELMSFLADDSSLEVTTAPTISKDRRKRPGCFSALDEDIEDIFGPYSDVPLKRSRLEDEQEDILSRPRVPLMKESAEVKSLRHRQEEERLSMPPPVSASTSAITPLVDPTSEASSQPGHSDRQSGFTFAPRKNDPVPPADENNAFNSSQPLSENKLDQNSINASTAEPQASNLKPEPQTGTNLFPTFNFGHSPAKGPDAKDANIPDSSRPVDSLISAKSSNQAAGPAVDKVDAATKSAGFSFGNSFSQPEGGSKNLFGSATAVDDSAAEKPAFSFGASKTEQAIPTTFGTPAKFTSGSNSTADVAPLKDNSKVELSTNPAPSQFTFGPAKPSTSTGQTPKFSFGTTNNNSDLATPSNETKSSTPSFSFAVPTVKTDSKESVSTEIKPSAAFSFNTATADATKADTTTGGTSDSAKPSFGFASKPQESSPFAFKKSTDADQPKFTFGNQSASTEQKAATDSTPVPAANPIAEPQKATDSIFGATSGTKVASQPRTFQFGSGNKTDGDMAGVASSAPAEGNNNGFSSMTQPKTENSNTAFAFGSTSGTSAPEPAQTGFVFGANSSGLPTSGPAFGQAAGSAGGTTFGQSATQSQAPIFGASTTKSAMPTFGQAGAQSNTPLFGQPATSQPSTANFSTGTTQAGGFNFGVPQPQSGTPAFGAGSTTNGPTFTFGDSASKPGPSFSFGNSASAPPTNASMPGAFTAQGQPTNNTFQFSAPAQGQQPSNQAFAFGASAPSSGFVSPAVMSPSIQAAGSPNPFNFTAAPGAAGAAANGARKIAQPRSRKPRAGR